MAISPQSVRFIPLAIFAALSALYFGLLLKADDSGQLMMSVLFYLCLASFGLDKTRQFTTQFKLWSVLPGIALCSWVLLQSLHTPDDYTVRLFPFIAGLGAGLIACSWQGLSQIKKELCLLFFLGVPSTFCYYFVDISVLTAKVSALMLWYAGQNIWSQGHHIGLVGGKSIQVVYDCSGIDMVNYFLALSVLCLIQYPLRYRRGLWIPFVGMLIGFIVNCLRVVMLVLFNNFDQAAFQNWHTGSGSYTFAMIGVLVLGGIYWLVMCHDVPDKHRADSA